MADVTGDTGTPNPYQAPSSALVEQNEGQDFRGIPPEATFNVVGTMNEAWDAFKRQPGVAILGFVTFFIVTMVAAITIIGYFLVLPVLGWGLCKFLMNMYDGEATVGDLFSGFSRYGTALGRFLLMGLMMGMAGVLAGSLMMIGAVMENIALQLVGTLVYYAVLAIVFPRLYLAPFLIVDQDMGAMDALTEAWNAGQGRMGILIGLLFLSGAVGAVGILGLFIGILVTMPLSYLMWISAYRQMVPARTT